MNNRECIDQVERGYRMAQPSHINYPESKTHAKELAAAQANVYKVKNSKKLKKYLYMIFLHQLYNSQSIDLYVAYVFQIMLECWNREPSKRPTFEFLTHMFEDFNITTQNQYME